MESANTLPAALAAGGCVLHALVRVELTNGIVLTGRILQLDAATMNMKLDAITDTGVRRGGGEWESDPAALRCVSSVVLRGSHVRFVDFIDEESNGGRGLHEILAIARTVRPSQA